MRMNPWDGYVTSRQLLLDKITLALSRDERFIAAWLTGSFSREEEDELSDLDLTVVVADAYSNLLCRRERQVSSSTIPERLALFNQFGQPAVIHENNKNAPEGGTFTFTLYAGSALMVDWTLVPQANVQRPEHSRLLFDKVGILLAHPDVVDDIEKRMERISELCAFFWMMIAITIKYIYRNDGVFVQHWLETLTGLVKEVERLLGGRPASYHRGSWTKMVCSSEEQLRAIRDLCTQMEGAMMQMNGAGGKVSPAPIKEIQTLLSLVDQK